VALKCATEPGTDGARRAGGLLKRTELLLGPFWFGPQQEAHMSQTLHLVGKEAESAGVEVGRGYRYFVRLVPRTEVFQVRVDRVRNPFAGTVGGKRWLSGRCHARSR
jgi:hypothetical protein